MVYNVVYISDDNYVVPTKASINSIKKNCAEQEFVIHIIAVEVSAEHQVEFESLATDNLRIDIINVQNEFRDLGLGHHYISKADLFKFKLPVLFKNLDRILYVDGDMIMSSEFTEIYTYDISNVYGGVCLDVFSTKEGKWNEYVGHEHYFNGGLLYLNLKKMREDNISEKLIEYKKNDKCNVFMDQNCLNAIMGDNAVWLPPKFNLGPYEIKKYNANPKKYLSYFANFYGISEEEMKNTFEKPAILHLAGKKKVWKNVFADNFDIWIQYIDERDIPKCTISYLQSLREENIQLRKDLLKLKSHTLYGLLAKFYHLIKR